MVGSLTAFGLGTAALSVTPWALACPWRALTGTLCPLCGATTGLRYLLQGDLAAAWASNQLTFAVGVVLALASVAWVVELVGGPAVRVPRALREQRLWRGRRAQRLGRALRQQRTWYVGGAALALGFMIWRNVWG